MIETIRNIDFFLAFIFIVLATFIIVKISKKYDDENRRYFIYLGVLKLISSQLFCFLYVYYYGYGDTIRFFRFGQFYKLLLFEINNLSFWDWLTMPNWLFKSLVIHKVDYSYGFADSSFVINKISGILSFFTFNSFLVNASLFAMFAFSGAWKMYQAFRTLYPSLSKDFALAILFVPSVVFWGAGLMKDTICIGAIGWMTWSICNLFFIKEKTTFSKKVFSLIILYFSIYIIFIIKTYIVVSLLAGVFIWIVFNYRDSIKNSILRVVFTPFLIIFSGLGIFFGLQLMSEELNKYALESVVDTALSLSANLSKLDAGSSYDLGPMDPSLTGLIRKIPAAVNVTLFRPYLWETKNFIMIIAAIESLLVLLISLRIFFKVGIFKFFNGILGNGIVIYCLLFSIVFGFATGMSSQNFGSLVRYKIPIMPMYFSGLFILYYIKTGESFIDSFVSKYSKKKKKKPSLSNTHNKI